MALAPTHARRSSQLSVDDDSTLNSQRSEQDLNHGAGGSNATRSVDGSQPRINSQETTPERQRNLASARRLDQERDTSKRTHTSHRLSGFLLGGLGTRGDDVVGAPLRHREKNKDKRPQDGQPLPGKRSAARHGTKDTKPTESSPLSQHVNGIDDDGNDGLRISLSQTNHKNSKYGVDAHSHDHNAPSGTDINPTEIVHMALNLSESRKRHSSAGHLVVPPVTRGKRTTSIGIQPGVGGSLGRQVYQHRRSLREASGNGRRSPSTGIGSPSPSSASPFHEPAVILQQGQDLNYQPSAATIARAERARRYIELSFEFKRMLQFLPPLGQDGFSSSAAATSEPSRNGMANDKNVLGRAYNPLQYIRNRKLRARERRPLHPDSDAFENVDQVHDWIDVVGARSQQAEYKDSRLIVLPPFGGQQMDEEGSESLSHRQTGRNQGKRPRNDWSASPAELFADVYWTEQSDHKMLVEDRNGNKLCKPSSTLHNQPRASREVTREDKDGRNFNELTLTQPTDEDHTDSDGSRRGRELKKPSKEKRDSTILGRRRWHSRARSSSSSGLSSSEDEGAHRQKSWVDDNTGPLERHMRERMASEAKVTGPSSPSAPSPPRWDAPPPHRSATAEYTENLPSRASLEVPSQRNSLEVPSLWRSRRPHRLAEQSREPRSSLDDSDYTRPNSPKDQRPSHSRKHSNSLMTLKFGFNKADFRGRQGATSDPQADKQPTRQSRQSTFNDDSRAPSPVHGIFKRTTQKSEGSNQDLLDRPLSSQDLKEGKDQVAAASSMTRLFRAPQRIGELVRTEGSRVGDLLWKKDARSDESDTSESDTDSSASDSERGKFFKSKSLIRRRVVEDSADLQPRKADYVLPTFVSSHGRTDTSAPVSPDSPEPRDDRVRGRRRSKFGRQATKPGSSFESVPLSSHQAYRLTESPSQSNSRESKSPSRVRHASRRLTAVLDFPGGVGRAGLPVTGLSQAASGNSRPGTKRQWSITDESPSRPRGNSVVDSDAVNQADLVRTRALLLSSGIKARELARRAQSAPDKPPSLLTSAAEVAKEDPRRIYKIPRSQEHVVAARLLSRSLESCASTLRSSLETFPRQTEEPLAKRLEKLRAKLHTELAPKVHTCADEADTFAAELGGSLRLRGKKISDRVDMMIRARRRHMRWVRRGGWVLVEWAVLGFMWWLWFIVMIARIIIGTVTGVFKIVKWLLWL